MFFYVSVIPRELELIAGQGQRSWCFSISHWQ